MDVLVDESARVAILIGRDDGVFREALFHSQSHCLGDDLPEYFEEGDGSLILYSAAVFLFGDEGDVPLQQELAQHFSFSRLVGYLGEDGDEFLGEGFYESCSDS